MQEGKNDELEGLKTRLKAELKRGPVATPISPPDGSNAAVVAVPAEGPHVEMVGNSNTSLDAQLMAWLDSENSDTRQQAQYLEAPGDRGEQAARGGA